MPCPNVCRFGFIDKNVQHVACTRRILQIPCATAVMTMFRLNKTYGCFWIMLQTFFAIHSKLRSWCKCIKRQFQLKQFFCIVSVDHFCTTCPNNCRNTKITNSIQKALLRRSYIDYLMPLPCTVFFSCFRRQHNFVRLTYIRCSASCAFQAKQSSVVYFSHANLYIGESTVSFSFEY